MLGVLVPEVECAVAAGGAEGALGWVEVDAVDGVAVGCVGGAVGVVLAVAFEGEVGAGRELVRGTTEGDRERQGETERDSLPLLFLWNQRT